MTDAIRDGNHVPVALGRSSASATTPLPFQVDSVTGRLKVDLAGGSGTVTSVSVVTANGFAGTVADETTTPAITLTTTVTGILSGNGTAISAASTTGSGDVVLATSPTLVTPNIGAATGTSLTTTGALRSNTSLILQETAATTDTVTIQAPADITASYTLTLPIDDGASGEFLQTDGSGNLTWAAASGSSGITIGTTTITSGTNTRILYNNAGVVGEYTLTGSGTVVAMQTAPTFVTNITTPAVLASSNDSGALGASGTAFSDLFLASGGVINWNAGAYTLTQSGSNLAVGGSGHLTFGGADGSAIVDVRLATDSVQGLRIEGDATDAISFSTYITGDGFLRFSFLATGQMTWGDGTGGGDTNLYRSAANTLRTDDLMVASLGFQPAANDGAALGAAATSFSDLFLASGALIGFANGNAVITHSSGVLDVTTGDFQVSTAGTNNDSVVTNAGTQTLTNKTIGAGALQLAENARVALDASLSADGTYSGITIEGTAGATLAFGDLVYLAAADSRWELTDADASATAGPVWIGMCVLAAAADGDPTRILLQGNIRADAAFPTLTISAPAYVSTTAGDIQVAAPSGTTDIVRIVGHAITADVLYFNPDPTWIVVV